MAKVVGGRHALELVARGGVHGSKCNETGMVGEEMACAMWSRSAKGGRKSPNECVAGEFGRWAELQSSRRYSWRETQSPQTGATKSNHL